MSGLDFSTTGDTHISVGPAYRILAPSPRWSMPLSLRLEVLSSGSVSDLGGSLGLDFRSCTGRTGSWDIGAAAGATAAGGFLGSFHVGVLWRGGSPWKEKPADE